MTEDNGDCGAIVTFTGCVRPDDGVTGLTLEHYPEMTEKVLRDIVAEARARWVLGQVRILHRVGYMRPRETIVFVGVTAAHRAEAFAAAAYAMDQLKTRAAFWKKEHLGNGERWVDARAADEQAAAGWDG